MRPPKTSMMAAVEPVLPGGPIGLAELYRDHAPALRELCRRRLGDPVRAEDACHEALLRADRAAASFRLGAPVWPWLATIARNVCTDMQRRDARITLVADPLDDRTTPSPEEVAEHSDRRKLVVDALTSLPPHYRSPVYLRHIEGWSYEEIARHDRTSPAAVRSRLARGKVALRQQVEDLARRRGQWPLPALAPVGWLRLRATRLRLAFARWEQVVPSLGAAAPFVMAAVLAAGSGGGGGPGPAPADLAGRLQAAAVVSITMGKAGPVARTTDASHPPPSPSARSQAPVPPGARSPMATPPIHADGAVANTPVAIDVGAGGLYCSGSDGGPITAVVCDGIAGLTP